MLGTVTVVDAVNRVNNLNDILNGDILVGTKGDTCGIVVAADAGTDVGLQLRHSDWNVIIDKEIVVLVNINGHCLTCHSLAVAFRQQKFNGIGADKRRGNHEKDKQQEHQVAHTRRVGLYLDSILTAYHIQFFMRARGEGP